MVNNKKPNQKQPGEKGPRTFHYNPGNMSGKIIGASKDGHETQNPDRGRKPGGQGHKSGQETHKSGQGDNKPEQQTQK